MSKIRTAIFEGFEIEMTLEQAMGGIPQGRDCSNEIESLIEISSIESQLEKIDSNLIKEALNGYGAWDETELLDVEENKVRIIWIACGDISEEEYLIKVESEIECEIDLGELKSRVENLVEMSESNGHDMNEWEDDSKHDNMYGHRSTMDCRNCNCYIQVNTKPMPNDIDVAGNSFILECDGANVECCIKCNGTFLQCTCGMD